MQQEYGKKMIKSLFGKHITFSPFIKYANGRIKNWQGLN